MTKKSQRALRCFAGSFALATVCFVLTGCGNTKPAPPTTQGRVRLKVEVCPASSPEQTRLHKIDELGREFEIEIAYRDKTKGWETYDPDTSALVELKRTYVDHKVLHHHAKYARGVLVWEELYHTNGKVQQRREWRNDRRQMRQFLADGTTEVITLVIRADGSGKWVYRRQDWRRKTVNGLRQKEVWQANGDSVREEYDYQDGKTLLARATTTGDTLVVEGMRKDGTVLFRQYHKSVATGKVRPFSPPWGLQRVELLSTDGRTVEREFHYDGSDPYPAGPSAVHFALPGGGKRVVECSVDTQRKLQVKSEKVLDAAGKVLSERTGNTDAKLEALTPDDRWVQPAQLNFQVLAPLYFVR